MNLLFKHFLISLIIGLIEIKKQGVFALFVCLLCFFIRFITVFIRLEVITLLFLCFFPIDLFFRLIELLAWLIFTINLFTYIFSRIFFNVYDFFLSLNNLFSTTGISILMSLTIAANKFFSS